jgi:hypothetical protein
MMNEHGSGPKNSPQGTLSGSETEKVDQGKRERARNRIRQKDGSRRRVYLLLL